MHCLTVERKYGVPTAPISTYVFKDLVKSVAAEQGTPTERFIFVPHPVMGKSSSELRAYLDGKDPLTGKPVMDEIIEALTQPLSEEDRKTGNLERQMPRLVGPDTEDNLQRLFLENGWTDMLPIVLPTEERVAAMLKGTSHKPDEVVGKLQPTATREKWEFTVEKVAVNAVMAGAKPEYFPVILALASSGVTARHSSTSSMAAMVVVNGPIRKEIGMNSGIGAMGPYNHANATIGRAYGLLSQNLQGGSQPGFTYLGSQGNNYAYNSITFAENEERSPWEPFHVGRGFKPEESIVTIFQGVWSTAFHLGLREKYWREHVTDMVRGINPNGNITFILDPIAADLFVKRGGFNTKEKLSQWVSENTLQPAGVFWDDQFVQNYILPNALKGQEPYATWLKAPENTIIPRFPPSRIHVVVMGGETNGYWRIMGTSDVKSVSIDKWR